jgi:hypothetical protein
MHGTPHHSRSLASKKHGLIITRSRVLGLPYLGSTALFSTGSTVVPLTKIGDLCEAVHGSVSYTV